MAQLGIKSLIIMSKYMSRNAEIYDLLNHLTTIIKDIPNNRIFLTGDFNSKSMFWLSRETNARRQGDYRSKIQNLKGGDPIGANDLGPRIF